MKKILVAATALFAFTQCSEEEVVPVRPEASKVEVAALPVAATGSMNITGVYTTYESVEDCSTCTFVVPADMTVVDGNELNLKAGAVICLDKTISYGDIDFVNLEGTESAPIIIGTTDIKKL